jgi:hypothetical protein
MERRFAGVAAKKMKPTKKHRPAMWECMLGTVYAQNDTGEIKYFDYKWEDAKTFAGISSDRDPRVFKTDKNMNYEMRYELPSKGNLVLWILEK